MGSPLGDAVLVGFNVVCSKRYRKSWFKMKGENDV